MARKTKELQIQSDGRDKGKIFVITEAPAAQAERWAIRCVMSLIRSGATIPEDIAQAGILGLLRIGLQSLGQLSYKDAEELLEEMMTCVQLRFDPRNPMTRALVDSDIEEVGTYFTLRKEVIDLHTGFFTLVNPPKQDPPLPLND